MAVAIASLGVHRTGPARRRARRPRPARAGTRVSRRWSVSARPGRPCRWRPPWSRCWSAPAWSPSPAARPTAPAVGGIALTVAGPLYVGLPLGALISIGWTHSREAAFLVVLTVVASDSTAVLRRAPVRSQACWRRPSARRRRSRARSADSSAAQWLWRGWEACGCRPCRSGPGSCWRRAGDARHRRRPARVGAETCGAGQGQLAPHSRPRRRARSHRRAAAGDSGLLRRASRRLARACCEAHRDSRVDRLHRHQRAVGRSTPIPIACASWRWPRGAAPTRWRRRFSATDRRLPPSASRRRSTRLAGDAPPGRGSSAAADGLIDVATHPDVDILLCASSGTTALEAVLAAIDAGKTIALANKEVLVMAGELVDQGGPGPWRRAAARGQRAQRHPPVPARARRRRSAEAGAHGVGRSVSRVAGRAPADRASRGRAAPSDVADGPQDHHRLGDADEQGPRGHRGALAVRRAARAASTSSCTRSRSSTRWSSSPTARPSRSWASPTCGCRSSTRFSYPDRWGALLPPLDLTRAARWSSSRRTRRGSRVCVWPTTR